MDVFEIFLHCHFTNGFLFKELLAEFRQELDAAKKEIIDGKSVKIRKRIMNQHVGGACHTSNCGRWSWFVLFLLI